MQTVKTNAMNAGVELLAVLDAAERELQAMRYVAGAALREARYHDTRADFSSTLGQAQHVRQVFLALLRAVDGLPRE